MDFWIPDASSGEIVSPSELVAKVPLEAIARWQDLRGGARYPARSDEVLALAGDNTLLVGVIGEGQDYEYRRVGPALVAGFGMDFSGQRLSEIEANMPRFGIGLRMLYEMVRSGAEPLCYRGWAGLDMPGAQFVYYESVTLPFGADPDRVDHLLVVSVLVLRDKDKLPQRLKV
ncbi:MAG TPA: hypothetical protein VH189_06740 [Rhizomicrobium sp.]|jgi:hypothetical protein|nr:hypothetical protein [Rhizomicrobium sp.]